MGSGKRQVAGPVTKHYWHVHKVVWSAGYVPRNWYNPPQVRSPCALSHVVKAEKWPRWNSQSRYWYHFYLHWTWCTMSTITLGLMLFHIRKLEEVSPHSYEVWVCKVEVGACGKCLGVATSNTLT